jgi:hypothetical protein
MDRRKRPAFASHGMMRAVALVLALLLAGCSGHSNVQIASNTAPSGGVSTGGAVQAQGQSTFAVLLAIGVLMGLTYGNEWQPAPEMDGNRRVNEQDCTKPIVDRSANLRCR